MKFSFIATKGNIIPLAKKIYESIKAAEAATDKFINDKIEVVINSLPDGKKK
jgi:hypothetical protein